jgi:hypothetical protein
MSTRSAAYVAAAPVQHMRLSTVHCIDIHHSVLMCAVGIAGTDANVSCVITGDKGSTPRLSLENSANNFERGARDEFSVQSADVGQPTTMQIAHDNRCGTVDHSEMPLLPLKLNQGCQLSTGQCDWGGFEVAIIIVYSAETVVLNLCLHCKCVLQL